MPIEISQIFKYEFSFKFIKKKQLRINILKIINFVDGNDYGLVNT